MQEHPRLHYPDRLAAAGMQRWQSEALLLRGSQINSQQYLSGRFDLIGTVLRKRLAQLQWLRRHLPPREFNDRWETRKLERCC